MPSFAKRRPLRRDLRTLLGRSLRNDSGSSIDFISDSLFLGGGGMKSFLKISSPGVKVLTMSRSQRLSGTWLSSMPTDYQLCSATIFKNFFSNTSLLGGLGQGLSFTSLNFGQNVFPVNTFRRYSSVIMDVLNLRRYHSLRRTAS
jgi:hypothetical protein